jgi:hypothetical protein
MTETPQERVEQLQRQLAKAQQLIGGQFADAGMFDLGQFFGAVGTAGPAPGTTEPLAPPPRRVPMSFACTVMAWKWWDAFTLLMVSTAPIILWLAAPASAAAVGLVAVIALCYFRFRGLRARLGLLKWGVVADVLSAGPINVGTYYSGTTYSNVRLPVADGWQVSRGWYSGPGYKTKVVYAVNGVANELILHGRQYRNGVILADSRHPERALCVSQFPYDLKRDRNGDWLPHVRAGLWIGCIAQTLLYAAWTAGSIYLAAVFWPPLL